jgi:hypothetical protein
MGRFLKGCRLAVSNWIKASGESLALIRLRQGVESVEMDEMPESGLKNQGRLWRAVARPGKRFLDAGWAPPPLKAGENQGTPLKVTTSKRS